MRRAWPVCASARPVLRPDKVRKDTHGHTTGGGFVMRKRQADQAILAVVYAVALVALLGIVLWFPAILGR